jgi:LuxR family maltose regulon positive regulatory protein
VHHLLRAGRDAAAVELLKRHARPWFFDRGAAATFLRLGEQLPGRAVDGVACRAVAVAAARELGLI